MKDLNWARISSVERRMLEHCRARDPGSVAGAAPRARLVHAREAVLAAARAWWRDRQNNCIERFGAREEALDAACRALDAAEKQP